MLVKQSIFHKIIAVIIFSFVSSLSASEDIVQKKLAEVEKIQERMSFVNTYMSGLKSVTDHERLLLRDAFYLKGRIYLAYDREKNLKDLSIEVYNNTLCLARKMGQRALIYTKTILPAFFKTEKEYKRYLKGAEFLETLETPIYSEKKIKEMCKL